MAIFSRRTIQRLIDETLDIIPRGRLEDIVSKINRADTDYKDGRYPTLAGEWELLMIHTLSKFGNVENEIRFKGKKPLDIYFKLGTDSSQQFLADIVTVSDKGFDGRYPVRNLIDELLNKFESLGLHLNSFSFQIEGDGNTKHKGSYYYDKTEGDFLYKGGPNVELRIPGMNRFDEYIFKNEKFLQFIDRITKFPDRADQVYLFDVDKKLNLAIRYHPKQRGSMTSHPYYKYITDITKENLFSELHNKAWKLKESQYSGPLGVIVCDGGYSPFHHRPDWHAHPVEDLFIEFLKHHQEISFILLLKVVQPLHSSPYEIQIDFHGTQLFNNTNSSLMEMFNQLKNAFPPPERDTFNAINLLKVGRSYVKSSLGLQMRENVKVEISSIKALMVLAGKLSPDVLMEEKVLAHWLERGKVITDIKFIKSEGEKDDDRIELTLSGPDPSISEFTLPPAEANKI